MGELLFHKWLDEEVEDVTVALTLWGVVGILENYTNWLERYGYIEKK